MFTTAKWYFISAAVNFIRLKNFDHFGSKGYTKETKIADAEVVHLIMPSNTDLSRNQN